MTFMHPKKVQPPRSCKINLQLKQPLSHKYTDGEFTMNELCPFIALFICIHFLYCFSTLKLIMQINTNLCWMQFVKSVLDCMASYAILSMLFLVYLDIFTLQQSFFCVMYIILVICGCFSAGHSREFQQTEKQQLLNPQHWNLLAFKRHCNGGYSDHLKFVIYWKLKYLLQS